MKKFTHLLYAFVLALIVPQAVSAQVTISADGGVVTVNSTTAGSLAAQNITSGSVDLIDQNSTLILEGNFNNADLLWFENHGTATKVDMTAAIFRRDEYATGNYTLYQTDEERMTATPSDVTLAIVGASLYRAVVGDSYYWANSDYASSVGHTVVDYANYTAMQTALESVTVGDYGKIVETRYWVHDGSGFFEKTGDEITEDIINTAVDVTGRVLPSEINLDFEAGYKSGDIVKITETNYYVKALMGTSHEWVTESYNNGDVKSISYTYTSDAERFQNTTATNGQYAVVGGTFYEYKNNTWTVTTPTRSNDFSQMSFYPWRTNVTEAITSDHADETISREIFHDCTKLTKVVFMSGNAIGFQDAESSKGYQDLDVIIGENVTRITDGAFQRSTLKTLSFVNPCKTVAAGAKTLVIEPGAFAEARNMELAEGFVFPNRLTTIGRRAFYEATIDKFEVCETDGKSSLTEITDAAFGSSKLKELIVPISVTRIGSSAFQATNSLAKITFQTSTETDDNVPVIVETDAFTGGNEDAAPVLDVYLNFAPTERLIVCQYNAFNYTQMQGQTDDKSNKFGRLHFNADDWDYYQGDWKKGLAFRQESLNAFKDGYTDTTKKYAGKSSGSIDNTTGKYEHADKESGYQYTPANGWQQFSITDTGIDIIVPAGGFIRSYSSKIAYVVPKFSNNETDVNLKGKPMMRAFRVTSFSDGYQAGDDVNSREKAESATRTAYTREVYKYIPKQTGLILVSEVQSAYLIYMEPVTDQTDVTEFPHSTVTYDANSATDSLTNLLFPSCDDTNTVTVTEDEQQVTKVIINPTMPYPIFSVNKNADDNFRIFGFMPAAKQFGRPTPGVKIGNDMAYLKLPVNLFHWANEGSASSSDGLPSSGNSAKVFLDFSSFEEFGETTGITNVNENSSVENNVDGYFTLQGVKVDAPSQKGIYIYNGKKIMITK